jgi:homocitrate synthase NifV
VGLDRHLVVGKHSGSPGLLHRLAQLGYRPDPLETQDLLALLTEGYRAA